MVLNQREIAALERQINLVIYHADAKAFAGAQRVEDRAYLERELVIAREALIKHIDVLVQKHININAKD